MNPRILIFSIAYEPLVGGAELAVRNITDRLLNFEFDLITCRFDRQHKKFERIGNINVYRVGFGSRIGRFLYPALAFRLARKLHRQQNYQIVWSIMAAYAGAAALLFRRRFPKTKLLLTLQEGDSINHIHKQVRGFKKKWQAVFRQADYIQAISHFLADWARMEGATCPVEVVPNGVDLGKFQISNNKLQINSKSQIRIITVSRLVAKNGVDILIRALAVILIRQQAEKNLRDSSPPPSAAPQNDIVLQILGSGPEEAKFKKLAKELGIADQIEFLGNIGQAELPNYLSQAGIFVRPSRSEGLGIAFLEAMAAGLPIIGTNVGGIPDFLRDKETGLFCEIDDPRDLAEKIKLLMQNVELRRRLGVNGRKLVEEKYSWDVVAKSMGEIFKKL